MKLKLRDDKINKLEKENQISQDEQVSILNQEIKMLKDQLEQEKNEQSNPKIQKLIADIKVVSNELVKLKKHYEDTGGNDVLTVSHQFKEQGKLIDKLNDYLKNKAGLSAIDNLQDLNK